MPKVLVVDDSKIDQRRVAALLTESHEVSVGFADTGNEALEVVRASNPDLVITDLVMPGMSGLDLLMQLGAEYPTLPVVVMTGEGSEEIAAEAVRSGASGYVPKATLSKILPSVVRRLLSMAEERRDQIRLFQCVKETENTYVLNDNDTSLIRPLIEYVSECIRDLDICAPGSEDLLCLVLEEAVRNAVYHGNLEMGSKLRESDNEEEFHRVMAERRKLRPYRDRKVHVKVRLSAEAAVFIIRDDGPGFDYDQLPDPRAPERINMICGRGVLLMRSIMDEVTYNDKGNEVTLVKRPQPWRK